ncbi:MAG: hypothetical protein JWM80_4577 [Cyanobacteria bacterium RYN_339]|nr:hypothetical protein [Cyanobacteria bacterium RYN_339]
MRPVFFLLAAALVGCTGTGVNSKNVYDPISGRTKLTATVAEGQTAPQSVSFSVDGTALAGTVTPSGNTFSIDFDSVPFANGIHFVKATGNDGTELLNASIFIQNSAAAAPTAAPK